MLRLTYRILSTMALVCVMGASYAEKQADASAELDLVFGQKWLLEKPMLGGKQRPIHLMFDEQGISGFAGCNGFRGGYEIEDKKLVVGMLSTTMMICEFDKEEHTFMGFLGTKPKIVREKKDILKLKGENKTFDFRLQLADADVPLTSAQIKQKIFSMVANKRCGSNSHCKAVAYGAKPCGGPQGYLVISTAVTNEIKLNTAIREYSEAVQKENKTEGMMGACVIEQRPQVLCEQGMCTALKPRKAY